MSTSQGFGYWVRWQVPVCALIFIVPAVIALNFIRKGNAEPLKSSVLWKPCWRNLNPLWLLFYRAFACLCLAWTLYSMVSSHGAFVLYYFYTQWTLALVMCYFALGTVISAYGCCGSSSSITNRDKEFKGKSKRLGPLAQKEILAGPWGYLMHAMYQTSGAASILTDIVFWCVLVPLLVNVQFELTLLIGALHSLNALLLIGDTALNGLVNIHMGWICLFCAVELPLYQLPMDHSRLWFFNRLFWVGSVSRSLLLDICIDRERQRFYSLQIVSPCIREGVE
ncbi:hypothetical protein FEM48_Zijuj09G0008200 [Ziziphus jujuba var. spinosa]|uniref:Uncharacterized protein n=1 Tax=Ziziphus jujuba var. spinosa TaxID=714518 RepID=A0A978UPY2_ZIZJJ|nr:hypothetical protein FEM48_Zijuj09G0008200 [Ziziphus jujuba var. spinosa]